MSKDVDVAFEIWVSNVYRNKIRSCKDRGIEWNLSLISLRNILRAKCCFYTGIALTRPPIGNKGGIPQNYTPKGTDVIIERLDNTRPYEKGNCVAASNYANQMKSSWESTNNPYTVHHFIKMAKKLEKMQRG